MRTLDAMGPTIFLEVSPNLMLQTDGIAGFLALFPSGYRAFGINNVFHARVRLSAFDPEVTSDKNVRLVRRPAHEAALRAAGHLKGV